MAAACHRLGHTGRDVTVAMPGGDLRVRLAADDHLWLTGPVEEVCQGKISADLVARLRSLSAESTR